MIKKIFGGVIAVIVLLLVYVAYLREDLIQSKEVVKEKYTISSSKFLKWKGGEIHYTDDGAGFPILMIHGFGGCFRDFRYLDSLMRDHYRIIRVDLPGFGLSDFPKLDEQDPDYNKMYTEYFKFLLDTLHIDSMYVMGNSMGGMAAWDLAVQRPDMVKKLVLFNAAGYDMENVKKIAAGVFRYDWMRTFFQKGMPAFMVKSGIQICFANKSVITDESIKIHDDMLNREGNLSTMFTLATTKHLLDTAEIKKVKCPTLIVWGQEDKIIPVNHAARFHRDIPNSRVIIYSPCGHVPMIERPMDSKRDVEAFFNE